jgi:glycerate kinase
MKKVVLAIDSFKGCLSSIEADKTAEQGIKIVCPYCEVILWQTLFLLQENSL